MKIRKSQCGKPVISRRCAERQNRKHTNTCAITDHFRWKAEILYKKRGHTSCESSAPIADDYAGVTSAEKAADQTAMAFYKFIWNKEKLAKILNSTLLPEKIPTRCSSTLCQGAGINTKPDGFVQSHPAAAISKALQGWFQCAQHLYYSAFALPDSREIFYENYTIFIYLLRIDKSLVQSYNKAIEKQRPHKTGKAHKILSTGKAIAERKERKTFMVELEPAQLAQAFKKRWTELHSWWKRTYFA